MVALLRTQTLKEVVVATGPRTALSCVKKSASLWWDVMDLPGLKISLRRDGMCHTKTGNVKINGGFKAWSALFISNCLNKPTVFL